MRVLLRVLRVLTAFLILVSALLLSWQAVDIYTDAAGSNDDSVTPIYQIDDIASRLKALTAPLSATGLLCVVSSIMHAAVADWAKESDSEAECLYQSNRNDPVCGRNKVRAAILCAAIVFILLGVMNGGAYDVLVKAINICTECIGLG